MTDDRTTIDVYPVGVLSALRRARGYMRRDRKDLALRTLRQEWDLLHRQISKRDWHNLRQSFNGYLAEVNYPPDGLRHNRCGRGWTKRRAMRSLGERLAADNPGLGA